MSVSFEARWNLQSLHFAKPSLSQIAFPFLGWRLVDQIGSASFVSKFDLLKGYWQVPLTHELEKLHHLLHRLGYIHTVRPFGLRSTPATFQFLMNHVVSGLEGCVVYFDVVVYSDAWLEHLQHIRALFDRLAASQ